MNSCFFASLLVLDFVKRWTSTGCFFSATTDGQTLCKHYVANQRVEEEEEEEDRVVPRPANERAIAIQEKLDVSQTARLGFEFALLWVRYVPKQVEEGLQADFYSLRYGYETSNMFRHNH